MLRKSIAVVLTLSMAVLGGCSVAVKSIKRNFTTYNHTIHYNDSQQLLLNLVRMRYRDSPLFMKVGAVSTSYSYELRGGGSLGSSFGESNWGVTTGGAYAEKPTVTYTPIEGDTFVRHMLAEINVNSLVLLFRSGWPIETLSHVLVEKINAHENNRDSPGYAGFEETVARLSAAQKRGDLELVVRGESVSLRINRDSGKSEEAAETIALEDVQTRSFVDVMFYLAKNTTVPEAHADQVKHTSPNGWLNIHHAKDVPQDALVFVEYNDHFFSISKTDIRSKDTFALLKLVFQMQAGDIHSAGPVLTLPLATP